MSIDIRFPNITASTESGKLQQFQSYLFQLVEQLNWALNNIDSIGGTSEGKTSTAVATAPKDDPISNFNSIKGLIIKSADIVTAYYEKIDNLLKLSGEYVAEATFPEGSATFVENTNLKVEANSQSIVQFYTDIQQIISDLESVEDAVSNISVEGNIKTGILDYDGDIPIIGLEIGQRTEVDGEEVFNKYARFTANKLSFYDVNDTEVAYISDSKLYIIHAEVRGSFRIGGYVDTVGPAGDIVTKWVGG